MKSGENPSSLKPQRRARAIEAVFGLDVDLQPMQPHRPEGVPDHEPESLGHQPAPRGVCEGAVAQRPAQEAALDDVVDVDETGDGPVVPFADQEPGLRTVLDEPPRVGGVGVDAAGREEPGLVQRLASPGRCGELGTVLRLSAGCPRGSATEAEAFSRHPDTVRDGGLHARS